MIEVKHAKTLADLGQEDTVEHPNHYAGDGEIECMDAMRSMMSGEQYALPPIAAYWWGCIFKYLWRWRRKNGVEDLKKARQCMDYLLAEIEPKNGTTASKKAI